MKSDMDKKHSLPAAPPSAEDEREEYLSEEQTARFRKIVKRCAHLLYACSGFTVVTALCKLIDTLRALKTSDRSTVLAIIGYIGLAGLITALVWLFCTVKRMRNFEKELEETDGKEEKPQ